MNIKILGSGCGNCDALEKRVVAAIEQLNYDISVEKLTDFGVMMSYGMMASPGLVINEKLVSSGKLYSVKEIVSLIEISTNRSQKGTI